MNRDSPSTKTKMIGTRINVTYTSGQDVEILFDTEDERLVLGSRGLASSLPVAVQGGLSYAPETRTVTGTFEKVRGT